MMELFLLYLVLQLDTILQALFFGCVGAIVVALAATFPLAEAYNDEQRTTPLKVMKWCAVTFLVCGFIASLLPSTKSATILAGAYALKEVSKTDSAQRLAGRSVKLIEDWLESMEPAKKEKK